MASLALRLRVQEWYKLVFHRVVEEFVRLARASIRGLLGLVGAHFSTRMSQGCLQIRCRWLDIRVYTALSLIPPLTPKPETPLKSPTPDRNPAPNTPRSKRLYEP